MFEFSFSSLWLTSLFLIVIVFQIGFFENVVDSVPTRLLGLHSIESTFEDPDDDKEPNEDEEEEEVYPNPPDDEDSHPNSDDDDSSDEGMGMLVVNMEDEACI